MIGAVGQMRPEACPCCEGVEMLQGHGWVQRVWVDIWIHRLWCPACGGTVWMLPSFLPVHRWYGLAVIEAVVEIVIEPSDNDAGVSRYEVEAQVETLGPSARTGWRWGVSLGLQAGAWLGAMLTVLAKYAPATPTFERPSLLAPARQLLELGPIFVGWLSWPGRDDWIMALWQWGHGHGLKRLV